MRKSRYFSLVCGSFEPLSLGTLGAVAVTKHDLLLYWSGSKAFLSPGPLTDLHLIPCPLLLFDSFPQNLKPNPRLPYQPRRSPEEVTVLANFRSPVSGMDPFQQSFFP